MLTSSYVLTGCSSTVRSYGESGNSDAGRYYSSEYAGAEVLFTAEGTASYYADDFHGKKTANGETYNMYGISAAHPEFPLETIIRVTNLKNDRSVILRINDRMPDFKGRMIDLSLGAARELDTVNDGIAKVRIEVLKWGTGKRKK
ncbi:MAG: septal ring lytic transglycosylase RlpA family protein [Ignavibacteriaceae bacterium]|nr:septal ring lytic transglycosylase RlpA family protein [Ignavibacteriaceae bacterium]